MSATLGFLKHPLQLILALLEGPVPMPAPAPVASSLPTLAGALVQTAPSTGLDGMAPMAETVMAPHGVCGWIPSETGSSDWVCQAMGQVMPGIVFFVSVTVILL